LSKRIRPAAGGSDNLLSECRQAQEVSTEQEEFAQRRRELYFFFSASQREKKESDRRNNLGWRCPPY